MESGGVGYAIPFHYPLFTVNVRGMSMRKVIWVLLLLVCLVAALAWSVRAIKEKRERAKETDGENVHK